jgi:hypothetical protein
VKRLFVYVGPDGSRYALIRGDARDWLIDSKIPAMWSPSRRGWHVRTERLPDMIARAELDGVKVRVKAVTG